MNIKCLSTYLGLLISLSNVLLIVFALGERGARIGQIGSGG